MLTINLFWPPQRWWLLWSEAAIIIIIIIARHVYVQSGLQILQIQILESLFFFFFARFMIFCRQRQNLKRTLENQWFVAAGGRSCRENRIFVYDKIVCVCLLLLLLAIIIIIIYYLLFIYLINLSLLFIVYLLFVYYFLYIS